MLVIRTASVAVLIALGGLVVGACSGESESPSASVVGQGSSAKPTITVKPSPSPAAAAPTKAPTPVPSPTPSPPPTPSPTPNPKPTPSPRPTATPKPLARSATVADKAGDLRDTDTEARATGPKYVDVRKMTLQVSGDDLLMRFDLAGDPPSSLDAFYTTVGYYFLIDTGSDGAWDYEVDLSSTDDWSPTLFNVEEAYSYSGTEFPGSAFTDGRVVLIRVGLDQLDYPSRLRIQGVVQYEDFPDPIGDPLTSKAVQDRVPDSDSKWITLGTGN